MGRNEEGRTDGMTNMGKTVYPPPLLQSGGIKMHWELNPGQVLSHESNMFTTIPRELTEKDWKDTVKPCYDTIGDPYGHKYMFPCIFYYHSASCIPIQTLRVWPVQPDFLRVF